MKAAVIILALALFVSTNIQAQDRVRFGVYVGLNTLQFDIEKPQGDHNYPPRLTFGVGVDIPLDESYGFKLPILLQLKGITSDVYIEGGYESDFTSFSTVALQPQLSYKIDPEESVFVSLFAGAQLGLQLEQNGHNYPLFDFAVLVGSSLTFKIGSNALSLSVAYINYPYNIDVQYFEETENKIHWSGVEIKLSYEF